MKIQFIQSPTGAYNLAYDVGMVADLPDDLAAKLIDTGFAVKIEPAQRIVKAKTAEKRAEQLPGNDGASKRTGNGRRGKKSS